MSLDSRTLRKMMQEENYPTQPDLILSEDVYALRIRVFENGVDMGFHHYKEEEQLAIKECIDDLIQIHSDQFTFRIDSLIGEDGEWITVLVCQIGEHGVPFPLSLIDRVVYYSSGKETHLIGEKLHIHPRSDMYKWSDKVELLLEEYVE